MLFHLPALWEAEIDFSGKWSTFLLAGLSPGSEPPVLARTNDWYANIGSYRLQQRCDSSINYGSAIRHRFVPALRDLQSHYQEIPQVFNLNTQQEKFAIHTDFQSDILLKRLNE